MIGSSWLMTCEAPHLLASAPKLYERTQALPCLKGQSSFVSYLPFIYHLDGSSLAAS
jgi:hypothetical protein